MNLISIKISVFIDQICQKFNINPTTYDFNTLRENYSAVINNLLYYIDLKFKNPTNLKFLNLFDFLSKNTTNPVENQSILLENLEEEYPGIFLLHNLI